MDSVKCYAFKIERGNNTIFGRHIRIYAYSSEELGGDTEIIISSDGKVFMRREQVLVHDIVSKTIGLHNRGLPTNDIHIKVKGLFGSKVKPNNFVEVDV